MVGDLAVLDTHDVDRFEMNLAMGWSDSKKWRLMSTVVRLSEGDVHQEQAILLPISKAEVPLYTFKSREEKHNAIEQVAYIQDITERVLTVVLSAKTEAAFNKSLPAPRLRQVISRKHRYDFRSNRQVMTNQRSPTGDTSRLRSKMPPRAGISSV